MALDGSSPTESNRSWSIISFWSKNPKHTFKRGICFTRESRSTSTIIRQQKKEKKLELLVMKRWFVGLIIIQSCTNRDLSRNDDDDDGLRFSVWCVVITVLRRRSNYRRPLFAARIKCLWNLLLFVYNYYRLAKTRWLSVNNCRRHQIPAAAAAVARALSSSIFADSC